MSEEIKKDSTDAGAGYQMEGRVVFKIYNMPTPVAKRLLEYSRERCGDRVWVAIDRLLELQKIEARLERIEAKMESSVPKEEKPIEEGVRTFGGVIKRGV